MRQFHKKHEVLFFALIMNEYSFKIREGGISWSREFAKLQY